MLLHPGPLDRQICPFVVLFLWGYLKSKVYTTGSRTLDEFKQRNQDGIHSIPAGMLQWSVRSLNSRFQEYIHTGGRHLHEVIFKKIKIPLLFLKWHVLRFQLL